MPSSHDDYVMVRSRKTGLIDVRRANELSRHTGKANPERILHYIGADRSRVCRCIKPSKHFEQTIKVATEATHLNANLMMYLTRHGSESCTIAAFRKYMENRRAMWREKGVKIDTFHYMGDAKNKVCRCSRPTGHNSGAPRNPEIIEQCAEFFISHQDAMICRRSEWRGVEGDSPPVYSPPVLSPVRPASAHSLSMYQPTCSPESQKNFFDHDSQASDGFLNDWTARTEISPEMKFQSTVEPFTLMNAQYPRSGRYSESDIPAKVWGSARTSVCVPLRRSDSVVTTPLGTTFSQTLAPVPPATRFKESEPNNDARRISVSTYWSNIQHDADRLGGNSPNTRLTSSVHTAKRPASQPSVDTIKPKSVHKNWVDTSPEESSTGLGIWGLRRSELTSRTQESDLININFDLQAKSIAELSCQVAAVELGAGSHHDALPHTPVLNIRESRPFDVLPELPGKRSSLHASQIPSNMSTSTRSSPLLSSLIEQAHKIVRLPDQKELLLRHAVVPSRSNPPPAGDCTLCKDQYQDRQKRTIMLPECEHFIHEDCLLESFRSRDQRVGTCPVCNVGLCERTLADRLDTDRFAIFGSQFTRLRNQVGISFPQHNEIVTCASEEEIAAAKLRLIKDYVDVHSEENFRLWELNRAEPDWFMGIIRPVVKLFQAWDVPDRQSRYFVDNESFTKLLAWAELVRLMNHGRKSSLETQGEDAMYPQLAELHRKFALALERYDKEKLLWGEDKGRIPNCDRVAQDVVDLAMRIQSA